MTLRLLSKTSPEAGAVTYTYNGDNTLATVTDAKNSARSLLTTTSDVLFRLPAAR